ncbi:hypothetical protein BDY21DRAFT_335547 [Lineolata rhizophorae]|uniref:Uncharacterized protein n=1 Tax=Lineolata rhizophorae TaxID=578093 RepID=A0A6A6P9M2_9PEZI|nr:hypothetical protein BDY21DRAFT_335547 [Lineolata rhizophorae]
MVHPQAPTLRSLYRQFLREIPSRAHSPGQSILSNPSPVQRHIRTALANPPSSSPSPNESAADTTAAQTDITAQVQEAEQFIQYLRAQRVYTTLLERYNPGMNMDEEERVRLTARKVGMDLPLEVEIIPDDKKGGGGKSE